MKIVWGGTRLSWAGLALSFVGLMVILFGSHGNPDGFDVVCGMVMLVSGIALKILSERKPRL